MSSNLSVEGSGAAPRRRHRAPSTVSDIPARTEKPFAAALADLKAATGGGWREFAEQLSAFGGPWTYGYLNLLAIGGKQVNPGDGMWEICRAAAAALGIEPTYFREYREHLAAQRAAQLAMEIGLDEVLEVLDDLKRRRG